MYEYKCPACGDFELIRKFSDAPLAHCPTCGATVQKLLSAPAFQFKGTGWYVTDYAKKSGRPDGASEGGESKKTEGGESKKTEGGESKKTEGGESKKTEGGESKKTERKGDSTTESKPSTPSSKSGD